MIYEINNKYYVKVGYEYNEIEIKLDENKEVVLVPLKNRINGDGKDIKTIVFKDEQEKFKQKLLRKKSKEETFENDNKNKYRRWV